MSLGLRDIDGLGQVIANLESRIKTLEQGTMRYRISGGGHITPFKKSGTPVDGDLPGALVIGSPPASRDIPVGLTCMDTSTGKYWVRTAGVTRELVGPVPPIGTVLALGVWKSVTPV